VVEEKVANGLGPELVVGSSYHSARTPCRVCVLGEPYRALTLALLKSPSDGPRRRIDRLFLLLRLGSFCVSRRRRVGSLKGRTCRSKPIFPAA
jgi:hypothetical protein